jgi:adenylate kinase family enzyme
MERILIIGISGAGKSTLAIEMGALLKLPVIHLDQHFWSPGWVPTESAIWRERVAELIGGDRWIIEGNYAGTLELRMTAADTVVFLDFSTLPALFRVLKRWLRYRGKDRPDVSPGCPERIDIEFLRWIWKFRRETRPGLLKILNEQGQSKQIHVLKGSIQVDRFLDSLSLLSR